MQMVDSTPLYKHVWFNIHIYILLTIPPHSSSKINALGSYVMLTYGIRYLLYRSQPGSLCTQV